MIYEIAQIIATLAMFGLATMLLRDHEKERINWSRERSSLLDRIQARDLPEYKALEVPQKPREPKPQEDKLEQL